MTSLRNAAFAALLLSGAALQTAAAMPVAPLAGLTAADVAAADYSFGDQLLPSRPVRGEATLAATQSYFDFDALITLGTLALAGGAMGAMAVGAARRRAEETAQQEPAWRASVFRAVQADLAEFTETYRRAA